MGHYDCSNCGASLGIDYGHCVVCTPQEVIEAHKRFVDAIERAEFEFDMSIKEQRKKFIKKQTKKVEAGYKKLYNKYKPEHYGSLL